MPWRIISSETYFIVVTYFSTSKHHFLSFNWKYCLFLWQNVVTFSMEEICSIDKISFPLSAVASCFAPRIVFSKVWLLFHGCSHTDSWCKRTVHETRRETSAGEPFVPLSAARNYPSRRSPQPPGDRQPATGRNGRKSHPVILQVKAERNVL